MIGVPGYRGRKTSMISVTQIPLFQCSLCREVSTYDSQGRSVVLVAGITSSEASGNVIVISALRHFGRLSVKTDFPVDVEVLVELVVEVPVFVPVFVPLDVPELVEVLVPDEVEVFVPELVPEFVPELVPL